MEEIKNNYMTAMEAGEEIDVAQFRSDIEHDYEHSLLTEDEVSDIMDALTLYLSTLVRT